QQAIARGTGCGRQACARFGAGPAQRAMGQIERLCETLDVARLARGLTPQAVVDGDGDQSRPARKRTAPAGGKPHQGKESGPPDTASTSAGAAFQCANRSFACCTEIGAWSSSGMASPVYSRLIEASTGFRFST